eukprot:750543-Hanusia_phi.AAC.3
MTWSIASCWMDGRCRCRCRCAADSLLILLSRRMWGLGESWLCSERRRRSERVVAVSSPPDVSRKVPLLLHQQDGRSAQPLDRWTQVTRHPPPLHRPPPPPLLIILIIILHRFPMLSKVDASNYRSLGERNKPLVIAVLRGKARPAGQEAAAEAEEDDSFESIPINIEFLQTVRGLAREQEDDFGFGYINGKQWEQFVVKFGISTRVLPRLLLIDMDKEHYLPVPVDVKGHHGFSEYLGKVKSGEIK